MSFPPLNTYFHLSIALYAALGIAILWSLALLWAGFFIGKRFGSIRIIYLPPRRKFYSEGVQEKCTPESHGGQI